eukprot:2870858-Amphidinium_carterae.1
MILAARVALVWKECQLFGVRGDDQAKQQLQQVARLLSGALPSSEKRIVKNSPRNVTLKPIKRDSVAPRRGAGQEQVSLRELS